MRRVDSLQIRGNTQTRGLTLLELSVVLALIGVIAAGSMAMLTASVQSSQYNMTVARMQAIEAALLNYRIAFTRLPCPGDLTIVPTDATSGTYYNSTKGEDYGMEAGADAKSAIATATGACTGTNMNPAANFTATGTNTANNAYTVAEGAVPTRALQLPDSYMYDGWGNKFRYAVDVAYTATSAFTTYPAVPDACAYGGITVNDSTGAARSSVSVYALVSHGANGHGAYTSSGSIINGGSTNADEQTNCSCSSTGTHTGGAGVFASTFVQKLPSTTTVGNGLTVFDDIVDFRERWQMQVPTGDTAGKCAVTYVYGVSSSDDRVEQYTSTGAYVATIGTTGVSGTLNGQFYAPAGAFVDASGSLWVADTYNSRIQEFNSSGTFLLSIGGTSASCTSCGCTGPSACPGNLGTGNGQLFFPGGVTTDKSGNIWVADTHNDRVVEYNSAGTFLGTIGGTAAACTTNCGCTPPTVCPRSSGSGNGQTGEPYGIAVDSSGNVWVADPQNSRVVEYSSSGTWLQNIGGFSTACASTGCGCTATVCPSCSGSAPFTCPASYGTGSGGLWSPYDIAIDGSGNVWVTDYSNGWVAEYSSSGSYIGKIEPSAVAPGYVQAPWGITVDSSGNIWVMMQALGQMTEYNSSGSFLLSIGGTSSACTSCGCTATACTFCSGSPPFICSGGNGHGNGDLWSPTGIAVR